MTTPSNPHWDSRFDRPDYLFGTEPAHFICDHGPRIPAGAQVLAVADGEGRNSVWLAARGVQVTAMDASAVGLEKARALADARGVSVDFRFGDVLAWDWQAVAYDAIAAIYIQFLAPNDRETVFAGLNAALKPGGLLLLHGFAPRQVDYGTGGPPHAENMYTLPMLTAAFPDYAVQHQADYDAHVSSGEGHKGRAALIDFVATKPG